MAWKDLVEQAFYEHFDPARRLLDELEFHFTPVYGGCLNWQDSSSIASTAVSRSADS